MPIDTIIFDLGGVIIDIYPERSIKQFAQIAGKETSRIQEQFERLQVFERYESGQLNDHEFLLLLKEAIGTEVENDLLIQSWNGLLGDIPTHKIEVIKRLSTQYRILLLSNTNAIHYHEVENILEHQHGFASFKQLMEDTVLSYEVKMRKPNAEIYTYVLDNYKLMPDTTLFIDDGLPNVQSAASLGIHTIQYPVGVGLTDLMGYAF